MFKFNIKRHQKDVIDVFLVTLLLTLNMFLQLLILHLLFDFEQVIFAEIVRYFSSFTRKQKFHRVFLKKFCKLKETPVKVCFKVLQHFSELPFCRMPVKAIPQPSEPLFWKIPMNSSFWKKDFRDCTLSM